MSEEVPVGECLLTVPERRDVIHRVLETEEKLSRVLGVVWQHSGGAAGICG